MSYHHNHPENRDLECHLKKKIIATEKPTKKGKKYIYIN